MLILQLKNNLMQAEIPNPFKKKWSKCKCCIDLSVSYHDFQLMFLLPIVGKWMCTYWK